MKPAETSSIEKNQKIKQMKIKQRDRDAIMQALKAGVVPKRGLRHIQVGRKSEINELIRDMDRNCEGGATIRFIIGEYGSGKTFFLNVIRLIALEKGMVVLSADLSPVRRLQATGGQARALYAEMARNASTRTKPNGGAMASIVQRFVQQIVHDSKRTDRNPIDVIREQLSHLQELTGGYDFAEVISRYWDGFNSGNEELCSSSLRWLRAEYATKSEAYKVLGVRTIINDANVYDQLKLLSLFVREAGYKGLLISLDEMVNIHKLTSSQARKGNFEQILRILNDVLQGNTSYISFIMAGTPEFLMDTRRGLYSYEALQTRLSENPFAQDGYIDMSGPVIRLPNLTQEDVFILLCNIRRVAQGDSHTLPDSALQSFMSHCFNHIGDAYFRTPRDTVKAFTNLLAVLEQNPDADWKKLVGDVNLSEEQDTSNDGSDDDLATFRL